MNWFEAALLGLVQGLTEFLPISSSAHLRIVGSFLPNAADPGAAFTAITQLGTETAVLIFFWRDIVRIVKAWAGSLTGKVPRQDPDVVFAAIERHVQASRLPGVEVGVEAAPGGVPAYAIPADHPAVVAGKAALRAVYPESEPLLVRIGGTLPAATIFEEILGLKTLFFSFSTADERLHAPDEFFRMRRLDEGLRAWAELWRLLALDVTPNRLE